MSGWLLAIETTGTLTSVALLRKGRIEGERKVLAERSHGKELLPLVGKVLLDAGRPRPGTIAVSAGPGSFTGIRVGMSGAEGLGLGWGSRLLAVPTLEAWAHSAPWTPEEAVLALRRAGGGAAFCQVFHGESGALLAVGPPWRASLQELTATYETTRTLLVGENWPELEEVLPGRSLWRHVETTGAAPIGRWAVAHGEDGHGVGFHPIYLRPPQAERLRRP